MSTLVHRLLNLAFEQGASDVLLSADSPPAIRVNGDLRPVDMPPLDGGQIAQAIEALTSIPEQERWRDTRHLDFAITFEGRRVRGSASWSNGSGALALRPLPAKVPRTNELGLPQPLVDTLHRPWGLIVVTGPAGHGKTTSIASLLDVINRGSMKHIVTVEDPVEYVHKPARSVINHQNVGEDTPSFKEALKHVLRHNPDVILLGEIRDRESMEAALTIAETGHLVLTTLHANDSVQALDRIASFFPRDHQSFIWGQLAMVLAAVVNQRLLKGTAGKRVLAAEVLMNSPSVSNIIREGRTQQLHSALESERANGSQSMNWALKQLVDAGKLHLAEARRFTNPLESDQLPPPGGAQ